MLTTKYSILLHKNTITKYSTQKIIEWITKIISKKQDQNILDQNCYEILLPLWPWAISCVFSSWLWEMPSASWWTRADVLADIETSLRYYSQHSYRLAHLPFPNPGWSSLMYRYVLYFILWLSIPAVILLLCGERLMVWNRRNTSPAVTSGERSLSCPENHSG